MNNIPPIIKKKASWIKNLSISSVVQIGKRWPQLKMTTSIQDSNRLPKIPIASRTTKLLKEMMVNMLCSIIRGDINDIIWIRETNQLP